MPKAINKIRIIGSPKDSKKSLKKLFVLLFVNSFVPYFSRFSNTSFSVKPISLFVNIYIPPLMNII